MTAYPLRAELPNQPTALAEVTRDHRELRAAFARFPSGVAALCAEVDGAAAGLVATSFSVGVSYDPPVVLFSVQSSSATWPRLRLSTRIGVSILAVRHAELGLQLASRSRDRFAGVETSSTPGGALFLEGAALWLECEILSENLVGDHSLILFQVSGLAVHEEREPIVYHGSEFRELERRS